MVNLLSAVSIASLALAAIVGSAQSRPNFSGTWRMVPGPQAPAVVVGARLGEYLTLSQDETTLTTYTKNAGIEERYVYFLDGRESRNTVATNNQPFEFVARVTWDGQTLVVKAKADRGGTPVERTQVFSFDPAGRLVIHGSINVGGHITTSTSTYEKEVRAELW